MSPLEWTVFVVLLAGLFLLLIGSNWRAKLFKWIAKWAPISLTVLVVLVAVLAILAVIFYTEEDWRGKRAWANCKRVLEAQGEVLDWNAYIPRPVPDDRNFALTPVVASTYESELDRNGHLISPPNTNVTDRLQMDDIRFISWQRATRPFGDWPSGHKTDLHGWQTQLRASLITNGVFVINVFPVASQPQTPAADVLLALSKYNSTIEELRQASRLPYSRFPLNYDIENPREISVPHLWSLHSAAMVLELRAAAELGDDQSDKAFSDVKLILYLARSFQDEHFDVSDQCRDAILNLAIQPIWEGLMANQWSSRQLAGIQKELVDFDLLADYDAAARCERVMDLTFIDYERRVHNADVISPEDDIDLSSHLWRLYYHLFPAGWYDQNKVVLANELQPLLRRQDEIERRILSPAVVRRGDTVFTLASSRRNWPSYLYPNLLLPWTQAGETAYYQTSIDLAYMACALERYRLANGEYPETLDALVPQFAKTIPNDVINGRPLHYQRTPNEKFTLYSIGWVTTNAIPSHYDDYNSIRLPKGNWAWPN